MLSALAFAAPLQGQSTEPAPADPPRPREAAPIATLSVWAEEIWLSLLDRDGSWFGRLAEEGVFQRFNPLMDDEYELDLRSALFTPAEDARWARAGSGIRVAGASISHPHVVSLVDWRHAIPVTEPVDVTTRYRRERSLTAQRDHPRLGVRWHGVLGSPWTAEATIGVHFLKPSADVELGVSRSWGDATGGLWDMELRLAALDAFSDAIFNRLGVEAEAVEAHLDYRTSPLAARISLRRVAHRWRFEVHAGATNRSEVEVTFPGTGDRPFVQEERAHFAGALVQARATDRLDVAVYGTLARADTERRGAASPSGGFALRESTTRIGAHQRLHLGTRVSVHAEVGRIWKPEDRSGEPTARVEHRDRATFVRLALVRRPPVGWTGHLAWVLHHRNAGVLAPQLSDGNQRLVTAGGWRFASGFEVTVGLGWDLDAFHRRRFDGGHLRFVGRW